MKVRLEVDNLSMINWCIDASHQVHDNYKRHRVGAMTFGKGAVTGIVRGQNKNAKSSTETNIMGTDNILLQALWTEYFIKVQGYTVEHNILHQDNQYCMCLLINRPLSSLKRIKHIKGKVFLTKDRIDDWGAEPEYYPIKLMWINIHTKPKQES